MAVIIDMQMIGDATSAKLMAQKLFAKLSPAPLAGFLLSYALPVMRSSTDRAFASESTPAGKPWAPLAPSTIEDRVSQGFGEGPIQYRTGELHSFFSEAKGTIYSSPLATEIDWPGVVPPGGKLYSKVGSAQNGNRRTGAPPRQVLGITLQDAEKIMLGLFEYVTSPEL